MVLGPLSERVADLCDDLDPSLGVEARANVDHVRRRLDGPLRVALTGSIKAGKSTIINALVGRRILPTAPHAGEVARIDVQVRHGTADRCDVVCRDASRINVPLDDAGMVPLRLGVARMHIEYVDVTVASDALRDLTVFKIPSLKFAVPATDAVLYVYRTTIDTDVAAFRSWAATLSSSPVNSLGIVNKADVLLGGGGHVDPWPQVRPLVDEQARRLWQVVPEVVPVVALLEETAGAGRLTSADHEVLHRLATDPALDPAPGMEFGERHVLLASWDLFADRVTVVGREPRHRLLELLGLYGVGLAIRAYERQPRLPPGELVRLLRQASGWSTLEQTIDRVLRRRADAIKADRALSSLEEAASRADSPLDRELIRDAVEAGLRLPELRRLRWLTTAATIAGDERPPDELVEQLRRAYVDDQPIETVAEEFTRWRQRREH